MVDTIIWDPLDRFLWGIAITCLLLMAIHYLKLAKQKEIINQKKLLYGFSCLFIGFFFYRIIFFFVELYMQGYYANNAFYSNYSFEYAIEIQIYIKIQTVIYLLGFLMFFFFIESVLKRTKYAISLIFLGFIFICVILPIELLLLLLGLIIIPFCSISLLYSLYYFARYSETQFKAISAFLLLGLILILTGFGLNAPEMKSSNIILLFVSPSFVIIGSLITYLPTSINPKVYSKALIYWKVIGFIIIIGNIFFLLVFFYYKLLIFIFLGFIIFLIGLIYVYIRIIYINKEDLDLLQSTESQKSEEDDIPNILEIFAKPQKISEEEVTLSKEKKLCLVCKGNLARAMYICPKCNTFYCKKCSDALSNLENACWVCDTPFNESKPVKLTEKIHDEVSIVSEKYKEIKP